MRRIAIYPGSFDPVTNGHVDIVQQASKIADVLVIAIGIHPGKVPLFSAEDRADMLRSVCRPVASSSGVAVEVVTFGGLVVDAARLAGASIIIRGLRDGTDLDYEMQMAGMNGVLAPDIQTVFFPASTPTRPITATLVRQIAAMGGDISSFVPESIAVRLRQRFAAL